MDGVENKLSNSIALHQMIIEELKEIKRNVVDHTGDDVDFTIKTKHVITKAGIHFVKRKNKVNVSVYTMNLMLDELIKQEAERIDKLIDKMIDHRIANKHEEN